MSNKLEEAREIINAVDKQMAELFEKRMKAAEAVFEYKKENGLPILDQERELEVVKRNSAFIEDENLKGYYTRFLKNTMSISREYQHHLQNSEKQIYVSLGENSYDIIVEKGILSQANQYLNLNRRVLLVSDKGVPSQYVECLARQCKEVVVCIEEQGEGTKSMERLSRLLTAMSDTGFSRKDCVVALGGGVIGDLAGFAAATYMRGIDFYNIPTTLLSQIDSSIGGKTAINFLGVKNIVGTFYQPKRVLIDPELLKTLPERQISNGLAEAIKMALTSDCELFNIIENEDIQSNLEEIIIRSLNIKKSVVEQDERESGLRKILNFGHTVGHGIESSVGMAELYHGECVALGIIPMCGEDIRERVIKVLRKCKLCRKINYDWEKITGAAFHDKKAEDGIVTVTLVNKIGTFEMKTVKCLEVIDWAKNTLEGLSE